MSRFLGLEDKLDDDELRCWMVRSDMNLSAFYKNVAKKVNEFSDGLNFKIGGLPLTLLAHEDEKDKKLSEVGINEEDILILESKNKSNDDWILKQD